MSIPFSIRSILAKILENDFSVVATFVSTAGKSNTDNSFSLRQVFLFFLNCVIIIDKLTVLLQHTIEKRFTFCEEAVLKQVCSTETRVLCDRDVLMG